MRWELGAVPSILVSYQVVQDFQWETPENNRME